MGGGGGGDTQTSGALPWWVEGAHRSLVKKGEAWAYGDRGGYQPYAGERIAGLTPQEQQANIARQEMFNRGDIAGQFAAEQLDRGAELTGQVRDVAFSEFDDAEYQRRRNPYIDNVVGRELREAEESFQRRLRQDEAASVARGGSIGSYRVGLENMALQGQKAESLGDIAARGELAAYNQALGQFEADRQARMAGLGQATGQYGALAAGASAAGTESLAREQAMTNELDRAGAIQREIAQRELDMAYGDFVQERDYPKANMTWLSGILSGVPNAQLASQTTSSAQPGLVSQLTGLGLGAAAINKLLA